MYGDSKALKMKKDIEKVKDLLTELALDIRSAGVVDKFYLKRILDKRDWIFLTTSPLLKELVAMNQKDVDEVLKKATKWAP